MSIAPNPDFRGGMRLIRGRQMPGYRTRILIIDRDPSAVAVVRSILRAQDWEVISAKTGAEGLDKARAEGPDAIVMDLALTDMTGVDLLRALRQRPETADIPILVLSASSGVAERVASMKAGASDYLVKPPDAQELIARLRAALDLRKEKSGFVIAVLGSKGGVGVSVLAVNLALALRHATHRGVALIDAGMPSSSVEIMLNLQTTGGGHLLPKLDELERADFEAILTPHASGVQALLPPDPAGIGAEELRKVILALRRIREYVVIDTWPLLEERVETIVELADRVVFVVTPEITALRGARFFLEWARQMGLSRERIVLVLNRFPLRGGLQRHDIENALGMAMQATIADDTKLVSYSINRGVPLVESHGRSPIARQLGTLAESLVKVALR